MGTRGCAQGRVGPFRSAMKSLRAINSEKGAPKRLVIKGACAQVCGGPLAMSIVFPGAWELRPGLGH